MFPALMLRLDNSHLAQVQGIAVCERLDVQERAWVLLERCFLPRRLNDTTQDMFHLRARE